MAEEAKDASEHSLLTPSKRLTSSSVVPKNSGFFDEKKMKEIEEIVQRARQAVKEAASYKIVVPAIHVSSKIEAPVLSVKIPDAMAPLRQAEEAKKRTETIRQTLKFVEMLNQAKEAEAEFKKFKELEKKAKEAHAQFNQLQEDVKSLHELSPFLMAPAELQKRQRFFKPGQGLGRDFTASYRPSAKFPHGYKVVFRDAKVREIYTDERLLLKYSYVFDSKGEEVLVVEDAEEGTTKLFQDGKIRASLSHKDFFLSRYEYSPNGKTARRVDRVGVGKEQVTRTMVYAYHGGRVFVKADDGELWTYDEESGNLVSRRKDNARYRYFFSKGSDGKGRVEERLVLKRRKDGSVAAYPGKGILTSMHILGGDSRRKVSSLNRLSVAAFLRKMHKSKEIRQRWVSDGRA